MSDKIIDIPVKFKNKPEGDRLLRNVLYDRKCDHRAGTFLIDTSLEHVTCSLCNEKLNPMWVLEHLALQETKWHHAQALYQEQMARLADRQKTKCQHCGQMTKISHR